MKSIIYACLLGLVLNGVTSYGSTPSTTAQKSRVTKASFGKPVQKYDYKSGFVDTFIDETEGRVLVALPAPNDEGVLMRFIYATGLTAGLGSNPIGLDRGAFDSGVIMRFRKVGNKVIAEQENWKYRATAQNKKERRAVRQSFAPSFLWASDIVDVASNGALIVDLSSFLVRDHFGIGKAIKANKEGGEYQLDAARTLPDLSSVLVFPDNVEIDAFLTFTSDKPGRETTNTAADGRAITLVQHHSLIKLPDDGFKTRRFDPRSGAIDVPYYDFSSALHEPIVTKIARRFRLERQDAIAESGPVKNPIVFYVDSGAPEQIREALIEGASWWKDAFEAAGFEDAFRVEVLPDGVHPFDIRYNMIQWVHRQTRGWSYGGGVLDPRTGEMLKANVILGSQRVRQDRMIFEGLAGVDKVGTGSQDDPVEIALARIRQLAAHEVGHTLGFAHNFAASSNDRASVMDYPAPHVLPEGNGGLDFSKSYSVGIGEWDIFTTKWLYSEFTDESSEQAELESIIESAYDSGLRFVADGEARSVGTGHPFGSVWDNGGDSVKALEDTMRVRRIALDNFGLNTIRKGQPVSDLKTTLVPIYLYHRYQVVAAAKQIGGYDFAYGVNGSKLVKAGEPVAPAKQRKALKAILATLAPNELDLPQSLVMQLTPEAGRFSSFGSSTETFASKTGDVFDVLSAVDTAATLTFSALLNRQRAARLIEYQRNDSNALGFYEMLSTIKEQVFTPTTNGRLVPVANVIQARFVSMLIDLSLDDKASLHVRAAAEQMLHEVKKQLSVTKGSDKGLAMGHNLAIVAEIKRHLERQEKVTRSRNLPVVPPGSPIGAQTMFETCWHCEEQLVF